MKVKEADLSKRASDAGMLDKEQLVREAKDLQQELASLTRQQHELEEQERSAREEAERTLQALEAREAELTRLEEESKGERHKELFRNNAWRLKARTEKVKAEEVELRAAQALQEAKADLEAQERRAQDEAETAREALEAREAELAGLKEASKSERQQETFRSNAWRLQARSSQDRALEADQRALSAEQSAKEQRESFLQEQAAGAEAAVRDALASLEAEAAPPLLDVNTAALTWAIPGRLDRRAKCASTGGASPQLSPS